jgi:transposase InsO family protein
VGDIHNDGHEGIQRTLHCLCRDFCIPNLRITVQEFVNGCLTCQRYKTDHMLPGGLLLPLAVTKLVWVDIALDFIEVLPKVGGKSVILTVVERFSMYDHFIPLGHLYLVEGVAKVFFGEIVCLHGIPQSLVSDHDSVFTSAFGKELLTLFGAKLHMTTAFHLQADGQAEATNKVISMYLRCFTWDQPRQWLRWLPWAEYTYNTTFQTSLKDTPFKLVYGRDPPSIRSYEQGETRVQAVAKTMAEHNEMLKDASYRMEQAQASYKAHYDHRHRQLSYKVGDWVWLRVRHRTPLSLPQATTGKLSPRFYGAYQV